MGYVLVHGGGSTGRFWDRVVPLLDGPSLVVDLPGRGDEPADLATITVDDEAASVVADVVGWLARGEAGDGPIVLVAHSSGGLPVPGVVAGLRDAGIEVDHIVLNAALVPEEGGCGLDCMKPHHREGLVWAVEQAAADGTPPITLPGPPEDPEPFRTATGGDPLTDEDLAFVVDPVRLVPDTVHHYFQPVHWSRAAGVPVTYVINERDRPITTENQEQMAPRIADLVATVRLDCGHLPAVTHPHLLAAAICAAPAI